MQYYIREKNSELWTLDDFLSESTAALLLEKFSDPEYPLTPDVEIEVWGKVCIAHRRMGFFSDISSGYKFAGQTLDSRILGPEHKSLLEIVNSKLLTNFNGLLINDYRDGTDYVGAHSDSKNGLSNGIVAAISLGSSRTFRVTDKTSGKKRVDVATKHNQLLVMGGDFQDHFKHEILKSKAKSGRISLTFRVHAKN